MWFANITDKLVELNVDNKMHYIKIDKCCYVERKNNNFYFLNGRNIFVLNKNTLVKNINMIDLCSNKMVIKNNIYVSGEDTGTMYLYDLFGNIICSKKVGEHISDFCVNDHFVYVLTYHDNHIVKTDMNTTLKKELLEFTPQKIIIDKNIYVLAHNEFYSIIKVFDINLNEIKHVVFERQFGSIYKFNDKIIFNGSDYNIILSLSLKILSKKISTGEFLCEFSDIPIFENSKKYIDLINNTIYL